MPPSVNAWRDAEATRHVDELGGERRPAQRRLGARRTRTTSRPARPAVNSIVGHEIVARRRRRRSRPSAGSAGDRRGRRGRSGRRHARASSWSRSNGAAQRAGLSRVDPARERRRRARGSRERRATSSTSSIDAVRPYRRPTRVAPRTCSSASTPDSRTPRPPSSVALAPHRGPRVRVDLGLGPLLRGRRDLEDGRRDVGLAVPRGRHDARRARVDDHEGAVREPRVLASATGTPRCSRTRSRPSTSSRMGGSVLGLGGGWHQGEYRAYGIPFPSVPCGCACSTRRSSACGSSSPRTSPNFEGEHFQLARRALRPQARAGSDSRCGSAAAARR